MGKLSSFYNLTDTSDTTVTAADISNGQTAWANGNLITGTSQRAWEYTSTALAESSGDPWVDNDEIQIISGPLFVYQSALAVSGYSGLIHKEPYGSTFGTFSTVTVEGSEIENSDPDDWTSGWTDSSVGTKGVDYELDTSTSLSRIRDLTTTGRGSIIGSAFSTSGAEGFNILDNVSATVTGSGNAIIRLYHRINIDASNVVLAELRADTDTTHTNWTVQSNTSANSGVSRLTANRIYFYIKDGRQAAWFGDAATPTITQTNTRTFVETTNGYISYQIGDTTSVAGSSTLLLGVNVFGNMTTA